MSDEKKVVTFPDLRAIEAEASAWIARLDCDDACEEDRTAFREWQNRSPLHQETVARLSTVWNELDVLKELAIPAEKKISSKPVLAWPFINFKPWSVGLAAGFALIVALGIFINFQGWNGSERTRVYSTAIGAQKTIELSDGSTILLNTNSQIEVRYTQAARDIRLLQGEAFFDVASNPHRPFTVYAGTGFVRAVGTAFTVHLRNTHIEVTVTEGDVELTSLIDPIAVTASERAHRLPKPLATIAAGQSALFSEEIESLVTIPTSEINRKLSWRQGVLVFAGEPLAKVITDISRYTDITITIIDPELRDLRIGGYFKVGEVDAMFEALEKGFGIRVERINGARVLLSAAS